MNKIALIVLVTILSTLSLVSQEMNYDIRGTWGKPIIQEQLVDVQTLKDINPGYPSSWIDEEDYISAEIITIKSGKEEKAEGLNDQLTAQQKDLIRMASIGSDIKVEVKYNVKDFLKNIVEVKTLNFGLTVVPSLQAEYKGGREALRQYLKENTVDLYPTSDNPSVAQTVIRFVIDKSGRAIHPQITETSKDEVIDALIIKAINNMPMWHPAQDAEGQPIEQEFEYVVGQVIGC